MSLENVTGWAAALAGSTAASVNIHTETSANRAGLGMTLTTEECFRCFWDARLKIDLNTEPDKSWKQDSAHVVEGAAKRVDLAGDRRGVRGVEDFQDRHDSHLSVGER